MKIYISGPMTGLPDLNFPAFHAEAKRLRELGFEVVNPAELNPDGGSWEECLKKDIAELIKCDGIIMLPGWHNSRGACFELNIASNLGLQLLQVWAGDNHQQILRDSFKRLKLVINNA